MQKNVAGQKFVVFAFNRTNNVPQTGDSANITANLQIDFGASTATNDVNPTELEDGFYSFDATQAETNGDSLVIYPASATSNIQVIGVPAQIFTVSASSPDEVVQTADHTAAIADIPTVAEFNARTLISSDYFDPTTDAVANVTLVATTTTNTDMRGTDSAATAASLALVDDNVDTILVDTSTTIPAQISALNDVAATDIVSSGPITTLAGAVVNVDLVDTTTVNTDMRGTDGANTTTPDNAGITANGVAIAALNNITAADVLAAGDIDGFSLEEAQRLLLAAATGVLAGAETTTITIQAADNSKTRITATVDTSGNRTAVTRDATG